jgi:pimeloyl-ACP methyl ester carboxylesterase
VEDISGLIREAGGSAFVFGISSGAALAMKAAESGLNILKLALYEPPYVYEKNSPQSTIDHGAQLLALLAAGRRGEAVKYFMVKMVGAPAIFGFIMQLMPVFKKLKAVAHTLPYDAAIMGNFTVPADRISTIKIPTLIAGGGKSPATLQNAVHAVSKALPNGTRRILDGQTHNVKAEVLVPELIQFFNS